MNENSIKLSFWKRFSYLVWSRSQYFGGKLLQGLSKIFARFRQRSGVQLWSVVWGRRTFFRRIRWRIWRRARRRKRRRRRRRRWRSWTASFRWGSARSRSWGWGCVRRSRWGWRGCRAWRSRSFAVRGRVDGGELELDQHHVIPKTHRQVQGSFAG